MMNGKRWMAGLLVVSTGSLGLMGCTDDQIAEAIGDVAVVAGAVLIASTTTCVGGYDQVCHTYRDYAGNINTECEQTYDSCAELVPKTEVAQAATTSLSELAAPKGTDPAPKPNPAPIQRDSMVNEVNWGSTFGISFEASNSIITAMNAAKDKNLKPLMQLGLSHGDLEQLAELKLPSQQGMTAMAKNLNASEASIQSMIQTLMKAAAHPQEQRD